MDSKIRWGILGTGSIAHKFAEGLKYLTNAEIFAVASRTIEKADVFAKEFNIYKSYGSYEELMKDKNIDVVYIALPHPYHKDATISCMKNGKAVLCEKPFTVNAKEADEAINYSRENKIFLMEAMWTRYLPLMYKLREQLKNKTIGNIRMLTADFGFRIGWNPESRLLNKRLSGGAILDVGAYTISFASMVFGKMPTNVSGIASIGSTKVDEQCCSLLGYNNGEIAVLTNSIRCQTTQEAKIYGTNGFISIPDFWHASYMIINVNGTQAKKIEIPYEGNGYNYEAAEVMRCLREGKLESEILPLSETLEIMRTIDKLRDNWVINNFDDKSKYNYGQEV